MKNSALLIALLVAASLFLASCFSPWEGEGKEGTLYISVARNTSRAVASFPPGDIDLDYSIHWGLSSASQLTHSIKLKSGESSATLTLTVGSTYRIVLYAYYPADDADFPGALYARGEELITIQPGINTKSIEMKFELPNADGTHPVWLITDDSYYSYPNLGSALDDIYKNVGISDEYTILVTKESKEEPITIGSGYTIILTGPGTLNFNASSEVPTLGFITIEGGASLTLADNIIVQGVGTGQNTYPLIYIGNNGTSGTLTMSGGSITGHTNDSDTGTVYINGGTFTMNGGSIAGNTASNGGAVNIGAGEFFMNGGDITQNTAVKGGGVYIDSDFSPFEMFGGEIHANTAQYGGGVYFNAGRFQMLFEDGFAGEIPAKISYNTATSSGGGVYFDNENLTFSISSGSIEYNKANEDGGGIYLNAGFVDMYGDITYNEAGQNGGGIYINDGTVDMYGVIAYNKSGHNGGGVNIYEGTFNMYYGGNYGNSAAAYGGGLYVAKNGTFTKSGGYINGNDNEPYNTAELGSTLYIDVNTGVDYRQDETIEDLTIGPDDDYPFNIYP